jgi:hypothetical protein
MIEKTPQDKTEIEVCYTPGYIAAQLELSTDTIYRLFADEEGVIRIGHESKRVGRKLRRSYWTLRIPRSVFLRVRDRMTQQKKRA